MMQELMQNLIKLQALELGQAGIQKAAARIEDLRAKIPTHILGHYDRMMSRGKKALAAVRNQNCSGCHMRVPLATILTLRHAEDVQLCDNCGRYLYLPEGEETSPSPPAKKPTVRRKPSAAKRPSRKLS